jgi:hypothetical protein
MAKTVRKAIPKSIRFEVFKRDSFTCQYCGRSAPDVILEVDHINPVANGGTNDIVNLVTACFDCNRGKSKKLLSDNSVVKAQKAQLDELNTRREQMEMMVKWKEELYSQDDLFTKSICDLIQNEKGGEITSLGKNHLKKLISQYGYPAVFDAAKIALVTYNDGYEVLSKIGGICYNTKLQNENPKYKYVNIIVSYVTKKFTNVRAYELRDVAVKICTSHSMDDDMLRDIKNIANHSSGYYSFIEALKNEFLENTQEEGDV